jgi:hypothetical protein
MDDSQMDINKSSPETYEIYIRGHLPDKYSAWFEGISITRQEDGTTTILGPLSDQTALHSVFIKIRNMNVGLISINIIEQNGELGKEVDLDSIY